MKSSGKKGKRGEESFGSKNSGTLMVKAVD